jgi:SAM-dependent methyltransferase
MIARLPISPAAAALDVGTGTGTNLRMLRDAGFERVQGLDLSDEAIRWCHEKNLGVVRKGDICALPFDDASFDLPPLSQGRPVAKISRSGLAPVRSFYFNALLFVPIWCARRIIGPLRIRLNSEGQVNTPVLKWVLARVFTFDAWLEPTNVSPFGVSLLGVARKRCAI